MCLIVAHICFWFLYVFSFRVNTDLMLWKLKTFDLPHPILVLSPQCLHCLGKCHEQLCIFCPVKGSVYSGFCITSQSSSSLNTSSTSCHMQGIFMSCVCFHGIYSLYEFLIDLILFCHCIVLCSCLFMVSKALLSFWSLSAFCALCTSSHLDQLKTSSLVISLVFLTVGSSFIISVIILSSLILFINFSFSLLSFSLCPHSYAFILR